LGEKNILDARILVVNRLGSKCIQRLDLNGLCELSRPNFHNSAKAQAETAV
jgi:hypothetical protein